MPQWFQAEVRVFETGGPAGAFLKKRYRFLQSAEVRRDAGAPEQLFAAAMRPVQARQPARNPVRFANIAARRSKSPENALEADVLRIVCREHAEHGLGLAEPLRSEQRRTEVAAVNRLLLLMSGPPARSAFPHYIDAQFKLKLNRRMHVVHVDDVSDVVAAKLTIAEGGSVGWHVHPGSAIIMVQSGTFGVIEGHDCVLRHYSAGEAAFHLGQGHADVGFNVGEGAVVAYVTFIGVPAGQPPTIAIPAEDAPC